MLSDVCKVLEVANVGNAKARLEQDSIRSTDVTDTIGRQRQTTIVNESGLYDVILDSRKPQAGKHQRCVTGVKRSGDEATK